MKQAVIDAWWSFNEPLEGFVPHFYRDMKELVTVGLGDLADPIELALKMPMRTSDGTPASPDEIRVEWRRIKYAPDLGRLGWRSAIKLTTLHMTKEDCEVLVLEKLRANEAILKKSFPAWDEWPADAMMALLSWAWAVGPAARYPKMFAALKAGDFAKAMDECTINPQVGTIVVRNKRNKQLLQNAADVILLDADRDKLYWPRSVS